MLPTAPADQTDLGDLLPDSTQRKIGDYLRRTLTPPSPRPRPSSPATASRRNSLPVPSPPQPAPWTPSDWLRNSTKSRRHSARRPSVPRPVQRQWPARPTVRPACSSASATRRKLELQTKSHDRAGLITAVPMGRGFAEAPAAPGEPNLRPSPERLPRSPISPHDPEDLKTQK